MYLHMQQQLKFLNLVSHGARLKYPGDVISCGENPHEKIHGQSLRDYWILNKCYSWDCQRTIKTLGEVRYPYNWLCGVM